MISARSSGWIILYKTSQTVLILWLTSMQFSHTTKKSFCRLSALFIGCIYTLLLYGGLTAGSGTLLFSVSQFVVEVTEWIFSSTCVFPSLSLSTKCLFTLHMHWDGYLHESGCENYHQLQLKGSVFHQAVCLDAYAQTSVSFYRGFHWLAINTTCYECMSSLRSSMPISKAVLLCCITSLLVRRDRWAADG